MRKSFKIRSFGAFLGGASLLALSSGAASAAADVSGDLGAYYTSHFVSYGADVWGGGDDFFGSQSTSSIYGDLGIKLTDSLTWNLNVWSDINDNVPSAIGGHLQEVDVNTGFSYAFSKTLSGSVTYGAWSYAGDVEEVLDLGLGYDDTGMIAPDFALMPHITLHNRISGNGGQHIGSAVAIGVGPSFPLGFGNITLTIPASVTFFTTDDFQGGTKSGYGFSSLGGSFGMPLSFISPDYGAWGVNFDLIGYFTDKDAIPGNPKANFLTGTIGIKVAY